MDPDTDKADNGEALSPEKIRELIAAAQMVKTRAYAPYSKFRVGAALLTVEGKIFTGKPRDMWWAWQP